MSEKKVAWDVGIRIVYVLVFTRDTKCAVTFLERFMKLMYTVDLNNRFSNQSFILFALEII